MSAKSARTGAREVVRLPIAPDALRIRSHGLFNDQWLLLTAGDFAARTYNAMTVSWGSLGTIWNKPFAQVVVRPQRHTRRFMDEFDTFTLCAFPPACRNALQLLGSKSGRDGDKIAESGLTPVAARQVAAPVFQEAVLAIECHKLLWQDMDPRGFVSSAIAGHYPQRDYHRIYFGEIVAASGIAEFG
jgi:flavin reductase (DIM6/NTAB) family NADH-FMN oxidoreductase RutF